MQTDPEPFGIRFIILLVSGALLAAIWMWKLRTWDEKRQSRWLSAGLVTAAAIYVLFSIISMNYLWIAVEVLGFLLFSMFVWMGFHYSLWFLAMGWLLHITWDYGLHPNQDLPYVPFWYPALCIGFDSVIALYLAVWIILHGKSIETDI